MRRRATNASASLCGMEGTEQGDGMYVDDRGRKTGNTEHGSFDR